MDLRNLEPTVQTIFAETSREANESGQYKILTAWRAKLEKEPTLLRPFQIDAVVREVRRRMDKGGQKITR